MRKFPRHPKHPERVCWGCNRYCPATDLTCGNGTSRTEHPCETQGEDWYLHGDWGFELDALAAPSPIPHPPRADGLPSADTLTHNGDTPDDHGTEAGSPPRSGHHPP